MCLIVFAYEVHPQYRLILAANRDEFYRRPAKQLAYLDESKEILAGKDLEGGGTWMGITKKGRFAALTNYRNAKPLNPHALTRGRLVSGFLVAAESPFEYLLQVKTEREKYNPYNLLAGDLKKLYCYSSVKNSITEVEPGIHGLSNAFLDNPWPKVVKVKKGFAELLGRRNIEPDEILQIMKDKEIFEDHRLPSTGISIEWERILSSVYIESEDYGTRASSLLLVDRSNHVTFIERSLQEDRLAIIENKYEFDTTALA